MGEIWVCCVVAILSFGCLKQGRRIKRVMGESRVERERERESRECRISLR